MSWAAFVSHSVTPVPSPQPSGIAVTLAIVALVHSSSHNGCIYSGRRFTAEVQAAAVLVAAIACFACADKLCPTKGQQVIVWNLVFGSSEAIAAGANVVASYLSVLQFVGPVGAHVLAGAWCLVFVVFPPLFGHALLPVTLNVGSYLPVATGVSIVAALLFHSACLLILMTRSRHPMAHGRALAHASLSAIVIGAAPFLLADHALIKLTALMCNTHFVLNWRPNCSEKPVNNNNNNNDDDDDDDDDVDPTQTPPRTLHAGHDRMLIRCGLN
jgi:hypothetical protein